MLPDGGSVFEHLSRYRCVIVTGPHRSGTTIAATMITADTGLTRVVEEAFAFRDIIKAEMLVRTGGVIQGPYLLPWVPYLHDLGAAAVYMHRDPQAVERSNLLLRKRHIPAPHFDKSQADGLWKRIKGLLGADAFDVEYESLREHPLFVEDRSGFKHRQVFPDKPAGR